jgi:hypothetical protein
VPDDERGERDDFLDIPDRSLFLAGIRKNLHTSWQKINPGCTTGQDRY